MRSFTTMILTPTRSRFNGEEDAGGDADAEEAEQCRLVMQPAVVLCTNYCWRSIKVSLSLIMAPDPRVVVLNCYAPGRCRYIVRMCTIVTLETS